MSELPRQFRLAAGDYFMHGQDLRMRQAGLPGNVCCAVIKLDQGFDPERLRQRLAASPIMDWLARAKLFRPLPALFPPLWRAKGDAKPIFFQHAGQNGSAHERWFLPDFLADRQLLAGHGPGLAFDVVRHSDGTAHVFLSWNHTHLDARGLDYLLNHLNGDPAAKTTPSAQHFVHPQQLAGLGLKKWWSTVQKAHGSLKWLHESGAEPLFSLIPPGRRARQCRNHYRVLYFTEEETKTIDARCQKFNCGFRRSHFYLAASLRGLHNLAVKRGNQDGAYLVPVPHDTRKRGVPGPIFSNHLSILFYRVEPKFAARITDILAELSRQMTDQIRDKFPECCMAALDMFKPLPLGYYLTHLGKPTQQKFSSMSFSDSGDTCAGLTDLWGGKILEVTHLVPAWRPPGLMTVYLRFRNRLSVQLSWVDDCISPAEADAIERDVRHALIEEAS